VCECHIEIKATYLRTYLLNNFQHKSSRALKHKQIRISEDLLVISIDSVNVRRPRTVPILKVQLYCPASDSAATE